ncbi:MAG TPA: murein biosynthesis integral membrane protein MurJ [Gaiellales bacterium]|jgi:putative peptidoglycan lipid II flippase|nr:murein biosynthesis integral membrane protein MurJ [Gaiellales bacterium]
MSEQRRLAASTAVFGAATAVSRVAGVVREIVAASFFGSSPALGAFLIAFNVPNLVRSLVADSAISAAFVPVFAQLREEGREPEAWRVASIVLWLAAVVLGALSSLFILIAPWLMPIFVPGNQNIDPDLVVSLSRWMFPIVAILGMTGVVTGILNSYEIFGVPAMAPIAWNAVIILALVLSPHSAHAYAIGVLVATIVQFLIPLPLLRGHGQGLAFSLAWQNPHVIRVLRLMVPVTIGLGLINFNLTLDLSIATLIPGGHADAYLNYAFRMFMLPQGLFSVAVSAVLFPRISRLAARGDLEAFAATFAAGARTIVFLLLPAAAVSIVLAEPITRVLFQHSNFTSTDTHHVAATLIAFSLGLIGNGLALLLTRAFFALQLPQVPTRVAFANLFLNAILDLALYKPLGAAGIALSTAIVTSWNAGVLLVLLRRRIGSLHMTEIVGESIRIVVATVYCAAAAFGIWWPLDELLGRSLPAQIVSVGLALAAGGGAYLAAGRILQLSDMEVLASLADRMRGRAA